MMRRGRTHHHVTKQKSEDQSKKTHHCHGLLFHENEVCCECSNNIRRICKVHYGERRQTYWICNPKSASGIHVVGFHQVCRIFGQHLGFILLRCHHGPSSSSSLCRTLCASGIGGKRRSGGSCLGTHQKKDLGRPMPNFAWQGKSSRGSRRIVIPTDCGNSSSDAGTCMCARWSAHKCSSARNFPKERPSNARQREIIFPTAHPAFP